MGIQWKDGYSAEIEARLVVGEDVFDVAQFGPDDLVLAENRDLEEGFAELLIVIDGRRSHYRIVIEGARIGDPVVRYYIPDSQAATPSIPSDQLLPLRQQFFSELKSN